MDCNEMNFEHLVSVTAFPEEAVTFSVPMQVVSKYVRGSELTVKEEDGVVLDFDRRTFKASESMQRGVNGFYCKDTFQWQLTRPKAVDMDTIKRITGQAHHMRFTFLGGKVMWLRAAEDGWDGGYMHDSESCRVDLTATTPSGLQLLAE